MISHVCRYAQWLLNLEVPVVMDNMGSIIHTYSFYKFKLQFYTFFCRRILYQMNHHHQCLHLRKKRRKRKGYNHSLEMKVVMTWHHCFWVTLKNKKTTKMMLILFLHRAVSIEVQIVCFFISIGVLINPVHCLAILLGVICLSFLAVKSFHNLNYSKKLW